MIRERRKYFRFGCSCYGEARFENSSIEKISVKNISSEGLKIIAGQRTLLVGDQVEIRLDLPGEKIPPFVSGQVRWVSSDEESMELGIHLSGLDKDTKRELIDYGFTVWREGMQTKH
ncbi:MAG: PilZ domain-containing protein [Candidatus Aminicenantes bacterium]|nr:PilZ domain-containing protein [Candidatus Aminicenantes bacterium]